MKKLEQRLSSVYNLEQKLDDALGKLCPVCGAVLEEVVVVNNRERRNVLRCSFCHYRETAS